VASRRKSDSARRALSDNNASSESGAPAPAIPCEASVLAWASARFIRRFTTGTRFKTPISRRRSGGDAAARLATVWIQKALKVTGEAPRCLRSLPSRRGRAGVARRSVDATFRAPCGHCRELRQGEARAFDWHDFAHHAVELQRIRTDSGCRTAFRKNGGTAARSPPIDREKRPRRDSYSGSG